MHRPEIFAARSCRVLQGFALAADRPDPRGDSLCAVDRWDRPGPPFAASARISTSVRSSATAEDLPDAELHGPERDLSQRAMPAAAPRVPALQHRQTRCHRSMRSGGSHLGNNSHGHSDRLQLLGRRRLVSAPRGWRSRAVPPQCDTRADPDADTSARRLHKTDANVNRFPERRVGRRESLRRSRKCCAR